MTAPRPAPTPSAAVVDVERELGVLLRRALRGQLVPGVADPPLDRPSYFLLLELERLGPARLVDLAAGLGVDVSTASRKSAALTSEGLVERRPDPDDGRACLLQVSESGAARLAEVKDARRASLHTALDGWSAEDVATFARLLGRLNAAVDPATPRPGGDR